MAYSVIYPIHNIRMLQYTHYTEAAVPSNPINRYFFVYKRAAILPKIIDHNAMESLIVVQLLYGEAKKNFLNGRYLINHDDEYKMAAYMLYSRYGEYQEKKGLKIISDQSILQGILPIHYKFGSTTSPKIMQEYQLLPKFFDAMREFLRHALSLPFYGSCFFPVCEERPPLGYFVIIYT